MAVKYKDWKKKYPPLPTYPCVKYYFTWVGNQKYCYKKYKVVYSESIYLTLSPHTKKWSWKYGKCVWPSAFGSGIAHTLQPQMIKYYCF